jgi:hypothetical protein
MLLMINESARAADSYGSGGNASAKLVFGPWTMTPSYTFLKWVRPDAILQASAFAVQSTTTGINSPSTNNGNVPGEGPGCATVVGGPSFPPCVFAPNGMTNSTFITLDSKGNPIPHFLSGFTYSDFILNNQIKTPVARLPINLLLEYEQNLNAHRNPFNTKGVATAFGKQDKAYGLDFSVGQSAKKNDVLFGYSWWRIEQDAIIASWAESDQRAPTNILQNRVYAMWRMQKNVLAQYTMWFGRTLNTSLENNAATAGKTISTAGAKEPTLKRQQIDLLYTF